MTPLGPTSRALVAAARGGLGDPDAATAARVRARIAASIAGGAIVASTATTSSATAASSSVPGATGSTAAIGSSITGSLALKLGLVVVAIGAVVSTAVVVQRSTSSPAGAPAITATSMISDDEPHSTIHVATTEGRPDLGRPDLGRPELGRPDLGHPEVHWTLGGPSVGQLPTRVAERPDPVPETASGPTLAREVELIDRAMSELRLAQLATALQTIAVYERETAGRGQLGEDAAAIAIEAHCRLHDAVTEMLDVFDRTWPTSAQRARLTAACTH